MRPKLRALNDEINLYESCQSGKKRVFIARMASESPAKTQNPAIKAKLVLRKRKSQIFLVVRLSFLRKMEKETKESDEKKTRIVYRMMSLVRNSLGRVK